MKQLISAITFLIVVFYGIPFLLGQAQDIKQSCVATPEMVDTVMKQMNIDPSTHDTEKLKATVLKAMSTTTDCTKMAGAIQKNIIEESLPEEMKNKEDTIKFKNDEEAMQYFRTQY